MKWCLIPEETDPWFCLAAEEYLLKNHKEDMVMFWQCHNTVVVGKHQNLMAEINYRYVLENRIRLARRISGGGTVFHDAGNVNFSFLKSIESPQEVSFSRFTEPIIGALAGLGVVAETSGRNDLLAGGKKISGNAEHIFKNRVLHHGTLLFDADLTRLGNAIIPSPGQYLSKAVASHRSPVVNISEFLSQPMTTESFIRNLATHLKKVYPGMRDYQLMTLEKENIRQLAKQKFSSVEWIFGYSPVYRFSRTSFPGKKELNIELEVEKGIIIKAGLSGSFYEPQEARLLEALLVGHYHLYETILTTHRSLGFQTDDELIYNYF
jgi:lipoate-protein ligase A